MGSDTTKTPSTLQACSFVFESFLGILPLDPRFFFSVVPAASDVGGGRNGNPGAAGGGKRARRRRLRWRYRVGRGGRLGAAAAARIPASWCLRRWTIGAGTTEIQTVEAGSKAAAMMKMQAQIFGRRDRGQRQPSRLRAPPARRRSTRPAAAGAKDSCMDVDVHAAAVQIAMKSGWRPHSSSSLRNSFLPEMLGNWRASAHSVARYFGTHPPPWLWRG